MKTKLIGLGILAAVIIAAVAYVFISNNQTVTEINGYLIEGKRQVYVREASEVLSDSTKPIMFGNMPIDGGNLIIEAPDYEEFASDPDIEPYVKKLVGSKELLHNLPRYCLWLPDAPETIKQKPIIAERIEGCRTMRQASKDPGCQKMADRAHEFRDLNNPDTAIVIPGVSSERREYIPMGFIGNDTIVTNLCHIVPNGTLYDFGILESRMHMTWMRTVCGRLKSDYRYSRDLCYNTFPWPEAKETQREVIEVLAQKVLDARDLYPELTLADLYDPDKMPQELKEAHEHLDRAVISFIEPRLLRTTKSVSRCCLKNTKSLQLPPRMKRPRKERRNDRHFDCPLCPNGQEFGSQSSWHA